MEATDAMVEIREDFDLEVGYPETIDSDPPDDVFDEYGEQIIIVKHAW